MRFFWWFFEGFYEGFFEGFLRGILGWDVRNVCLPIDGGGIMSGLRRSSELSVVYGGVISPGSMPLDDDASKIGGGGGGGVDGGGGNPTPGGGGGSPTYNQSQIKWNQIEIDCNSSNSSKKGKLTGQARSNEDRWWVVLEWCSKWSFHRSGSIRYVTASNCDPKLPDDPDSLTLSISGFSDCDLEGFPLRV